MRRDDAGLDARQCFQRHHRAQIPDVQLRTQHPRRHADRRTATGKVADHLGRNRLWIGRHAFSGDTMIGGKDGDAHAVQSRADVPLHAGQLDRQRFQSTQ